MLGPGEGRPMGLPDLGYNQRSSLEIGGHSLENPTLLLTSPTPTPVTESSYIGCPGDPFTEERLSISAGVFPSLS